VSIKNKYILIEHIKGKVMTIKQHYSLPLLLSLLLTVVGCTKQQGDSQDKNLKEVVLIVNADIVTMNAQQPSASAMAIAGEKIIAIGTEADVRQAIGEYSQLQDLNGKTIVPGFIETHDHLYMSSTISVLTDVSPFSTPTLAKALEKIKHTKPDKEGWIIAFGADQTLYTEKKGPTKDLLDELFPKTPVMVFHLSGHGGFANSVALANAGINENTPDPTGGFYEKNENGQLTGFLSGQPALFSVKTYPNPTPDTAVTAALMRAEKGVTTSSELGIMNEIVLKGLQEATSSADFPVRVVGGYFSTAPDFETIVPKLKSYETKFLTIPFIKTWTDGSLQGGTAYLTEGYHTHGIGEGGAQGSQDYFNQQVLDMYERGYWPAIHANGNGAVDVALNAIEYAQATLADKVDPTIRPQIIHAQVTSEAQIKRMADLKASPTFFTTHVYYWGDLHFETTLGPKRSQRLSAMADGFKYNVHPSMHNDPPVSPIDPILNMWIAVNRTSKEGKVLGKEQAITPLQALAAYTTNASYQFGMEEEVGSLEVGKLADYVVLDKNPLKVDSTELRDINVLTTVRGGLTTYSSKSEVN